MKRIMLTVILLTCSAFGLSGCGGENAESVSEAEPLVSDTFELVTNIDGSILELSLDTDLPDNTQISIVVGRSYWDKGNSEEYASPYYEQKSTVGEWREKHEIDISPAGWRQNLKNFKAEMKQATRGFEVARISDNIEVRIVVPINGQTNPSFGDRNKNLQGKAVTVESYGRLVIGEAQLAYPL